MQDPLSACQQLSQGPWRPSRPWRWQQSTTCQQNRIRRITISRQPYHHHYYYQSGKIQFSLTAQSHLQSYQVQGRRCRTNARTLYNVHSMGKLRLSNPLQCQCYAVSALKSSAAELGQCFIIIFIFVTEPGLVGWEDVISDNNITLSQSVSQSVSQSAQ